MIHSGVIERAAERSRDRGRSDREALGNEEGRVVDDQLVAGRRTEQELDAPGIQAGEGDRSVAVQEIVADAAAEDRGRNGHLS